MLARIIEASIRNKFIVVMFVAFILGAGIFALYRLPVDAIPDLSDVQVIIFAEYMGQSPQVVED
ncbi:MAG: efflux RND transporter permease subunit, partial [Deltaproteobacteria bacterium]|nr:efflux RND transporter permease subunit [Deltaproteobacteria bacterium]